jgi:hypothetical protein
MAKRCLPDHRIQFGSFHAHLHHQIKETMAKPLDVAEPSLGDG